MPDAAPWRSPCAHRVSAGLAVSPGPRSASHQPLFLRLPARHPHARGSSLHQPLPPRNRRREETPPWLAGVPRVYVDFRSLSGPSVRPSARPHLPILQRRPGKESRRQSAQQRPASESTFPRTSGCSYPPPAPYVRLFSSPPPSDAAHPRRRRRRRRSYIYTSATHVRTHARTPPNTAAGQGGTASSGTPDGPQSQRDRCPHSRWPRLRCISPSGQCGLHLACSGRDRPRRRASNRERGGLSARHHPPGQPEKRVGHLAGLFWKLSQRTTRSPYVDSIPVAAQNTTATTRKRQQRKKKKRKEEKKVRKKERKSHLPEWQISLPRFHFSPCPSQKRFGGQRGSNHLKSRSRVSGSRSPAPILSTAGDPSRYVYIAVGAVEINKEVCTCVGSEHAYDTYVR